MSPSVTPPALPHVLPAPPGQEQVRLIADGDRKLDDIVLWCRLGAVTGQGGHSGGSPDSTHTLGVRPLPRGFSAPPIPLPGDLEHDFGMVQKDGAAELQLQGEGHLGRLQLSQRKHLQGQLLCSAQGRARSWIFLWFCSLSMWVKQAGNQKNFVPCSALAPPRI